MGYYATLEGSITIEHSEEVEKIIESKILNDFTGIDWDIRPDCGDLCVVELSGYAKYYEEVFYELFELVHNVVVDGCVEFIGEDNCMWEFIYRDGDWLEQNGVVCYFDGKSINKDAFMEYLVKEFTLSPETLRIIDNICDFVNKSPVEDRCQTIADLLDGIGIKKDEIANFVA